MNTISTRHTIAWLAPVLFALPMVVQAADASKEERYEAALNNMLADRRDRD